MQSFTKHPTEEYPIEFRFLGKLPVGILILSGIASAFRIMDDLSTTLAASYTAGDPTMTVSANVLAGAKLVLDDGGATHETVYVQSIAGTGPYVATLVRPGRYSRAVNAVVAYQLGATSAVLQSSTVVVSPGRRSAQVWATGGVDGEKYELSAFVTLNNNAALRDEVVMRVEVPR